MKQENDKLIRKIIFVGFCKDITELYLLEVEKRMKREEDQIESSIHWIQDQEKEDKKESEKMKMIPTPF